MTEYHDTPPADRPAGAEPEAPGTPGSSGPAAGAELPGGTTPQPDPTPPGAGSAPPPPPPPGGAFAARYGLVRPRTGRYLAGVSGAVARATRTDPVLWRVLFVVLSFFGGFGILAYVVLWLGTPADGDTASPVEALFGRGRSSTSATLTVIAGVLAVLFLGGISDDWPWPLIALIAIGGAVVFAVNRSRPSTGASQPVAYTPPPVHTPPSPAPPAAPAGYQPAFAPHGPYAPGSATTVPIPPGPPVPPVAARPPRPPKPPREHSRLGTLIFSAVLIALGVLGVLDATNTFSIPAAWYVVTALGVVGAGLVLGAFLGRARGMIFWGIVLTIALSATTLSRNIDFDTARSGGGDITWQPANITEVESDYEHQAGSATLDLTRVNFTGQQKEIHVRIQAGNVNVIVPADVDVQATANVRLGDVTLFDQNSNGVRISDFTVTDNGADGEGGGHLRLIVDVSLGNAEVSR
ncbi:PspC domain-containing protein [Hamadaea tsunoensis]|uniref:PspC domain-containing protein n=1 Tax=Hamadaea tsunoensis TaxID=53368 RepID=UPI000686D074|nr:LiaF domain-containing protein [Hamadaea tsunoensis]